MYFAPYIDASGVHLPTYQDRLDALVSSYQSIFGPEANLEISSPDYQLLSVFARALDDLGQLLLYGQEQLRLQNEEMERQNRAIMLGMQAILRDRLLQGYRHYLEKGYADYEDRENLENIFVQYHALGANGIMDDLRERFRALPTLPEEGR